MLRMWRLLRPSAAGAGKLRKLSCPPPDAAKLSSRAPKLKNRTDNPMQPANLANAPRCGAKTRSGGLCNSPAVRGRRRCRMHGGTNRGAPAGNRNAWVHGNRSAEADEQLKVVKDADRSLHVIARMQKGQPLRHRDNDQLIKLLIEHGYLSHAMDGGAV